MYTEIPVEIVDKSTKENTDPGRTPGDTFRGIRIRISLTNSKKK